MRGNVIQAHEADPAIDWLAEFEPELHEPAPPAPRGDVAPTHDLTMYPAVEPESKVHASTKLIAKLPRLATVRPEDTLFRVMVPGRTTTPDPSDALRFAPIEPDLLPRVSMRGAVIGVIVLVILSTGVLAGGSAIRRWGQRPEPASPPVAAQTPPDSFRAVTEAAAPVSAAAPARKTSPKPEPAPKSPPPTSPAPPAADKSTASAAPPEAPPLDVVAGMAASASPVRTTPVTLSAPPARTPAPAREESMDPALIQSVVDRYEHAFSTLSLDGITAFWPSVNTRTLAKAFDQLQEQHVSFDACRIEVHGDEADAMCGGQARFVPKIGSRTPRVERHVWAFTLMRQQQVWVIYKVDVR